MKKSLVLGVVLSLSTLCFAAGKTFTVVFDKTTSVGSQKLKAGEYKVKVDGANVVFTDEKYKAVTVPVKVETGSKKFKDTAVDSTQSASGDVVNAIEIGGTTTKIEFAKPSVASN